MGVKLLQSGPSIGRIKAITLMNLSFFFILRRIFGVDAIRESDSSGYPAFAIGEVEYERIARPCRLAQKITQLKPGY